MFLLQCQGFLRHFLTNFHLSPTNKSVYIIYKKSHKAHNHRHVSNIFHRSQGPKYNKYHIVGCIGQGKIRTFPKSKVYRQETCSDGNGARYNVGCVKSMQNIVKHPSHHNSNTTSPLSQKTSIFTTHPQYFHSPHSPQSCFECISKSPQNLVLSFLAVSSLEIS